MTDHSRLGARLRSSPLWMIGFMALSVAVLLGANGYTVSLHSLALEPTVLVSVGGEPSAATVRLDRTVVGTRLPVTVRFIQPGIHTIHVEADGYQAWETTIRLGPGQAFVRPSIRLWLTQPIEQVAPSSVSLDQPLVSAPLVLQDMELSEQTGDETRLITRFSVDPLAATLSNDRSHVVVQLGRDIVVTELDGSNTTPLVTLASSEPTPLVLSDNDQTLTLRDGQTVRRWTIR